MPLAPNFALWEFASSDRGLITPVPDSLMSNVTELARNLQKLRDKLGTAITVTSGYRSRTHNTNVGGVSDSRHLTATAADFVVPGRSHADVYCATEALIRDGRMRNGGLGYYGEGLSNHIHYDTRNTPSRWTGTGIAVPDCPPPQPEEDEMTDAERQELASVKALALGNNVYIGLLGQEVNLHEAQIKFLADAIQSVHRPGHLTTPAEQAQLSAVEAGIAELKVKVEEARVARIAAAKALAG